MKSFYVLKYPDDRYFKYSTPTGFALTFRVYERELIQPDFTKESVLKLARDIVYLRIGRSYDIQSILTTRKSKRNQTSM